MATNTTLSVPFASSLVSRTWEDVSVVYNQLSGDIHLLDANSGALLSELARGPRSRRELHDFLQQTFEESPPEAIDAYLDAFVERMSKLELIRVA